MKTDSQLQRDVIAELNWEPSVDARQIGVEVSEGVVKLSGHVHSFAEKWNAEQAAQREAGEHIGRVVGARRDTRETHEAGERAQRHQRRYRQ